MPNVETIVAPATPSGESALAVIRVTGPLVVGLAKGFHRTEAPLPRMVWNGGYVSQSGESIDDVLFSFFQSPNSYTGEDVLEISCHGNPFIVSKIVGDLRERGCRLAEPGEFTRRAFLNGRMDLTRAEAVMDVIRARSDRALEAAQSQLRGAFGRRIAAMVERLLQICAALEAYIDFPDEDLPVEDRARRQQELVAMADEVRQLRATERRGVLLRSGVKVVLLGEPNVGKSSLLNRLAGYERAIVSSEPGTTRDFLEVRVLLGPYSMEIVDTAGLREAAEQIERQGVTHALDCAEEADVCLVVVDLGSPSPALPPVLLSRLSSLNVVVAANKADLTARAFSGLAGIVAPQVEISALTGSGVDRLVEVLVALVDKLTGAGCSDEEIAVSARHAAALDDVGSSLGRAVSLLIDLAPLELVASEVRNAIDALGGLVGRIDHEAVLDRLFARFCIGK